MKVKSLAAGAAVVAVAAASLAVAAPAEAKTLRATSTDGGQELTPNAPPDLQADAFDVANTTLSLCIYTVGANCAAKETATFDVRNNNESGNLNNSYRLWIANSGKNRTKNISSRAQNIYQAAQQARVANTATGDVVGTAGTANAVVRETVNGTTCVITNFTYSNAAGVITPVAGSSEADPSGFENAAWCRHKKRVVFDWAMLRNIPVGGNGGGQPTVAGSSTMPVNASGAALAVRAADKLLQSNSMWKEAPWLVQYV